MASLMTRLRDVRFLLLILAALALLPVFARPTVTQEEPVFNYLFVLDISQSMNVRDYIGDQGGNAAAAAGQPISRLDYAKQALAQASNGLPCGSRVGLGLFTGWQSTVLFEPIEVCRHFVEITAAIHKADWRMTWAPQSNIARGLYATLGDLSRQSLAPTLVFVTDGDEAPPVEKGARPELPIRQGEVQGLIIGAGDVQSSPIPRLDIAGELTGLFQIGGSTALSALKENYLQGLAAQAGLEYHRLRDKRDLSALLRQPQYAEPVEVERELGWVFGLAALLLMAALYLVTPLVPRFNRVSARRRPEDWRSVS